MRYSRWRRRRGDLMQLPGDNGSLASHEQTTGGAQNEAKKSEKIFSLVNPLFFHRRSRGTTIPRRFSNTDRQTIEGFLCHCFPFRFLFSFYFFFFSLTPTVPSASSGVRVICPLTLTMAKKVFSVLIVCFTVDKKA